MDFTKFVDLISTKKLFFCRSDRFDDPFEGSFPYIYVERKIEEIKQTSNDFEKEIQIYQHAGAGFRKYVYINCWHNNDCESAALWKLYLKSNEGIAIKSTRNKIHESIIDKEYPLFSLLVKYIDYKMDDPPVPTRIAPFRYKRKSFEHEREMRAVILTEAVDSEGNLKMPVAENGLKVSVDFNLFVDSIWIAPTAPAWFIELVKSVCNQYEIKSEIFISSLLNEYPRFI
jgi:hypothetical protein